MKGTTLLYFLSTLALYHTINIAKNASQSLMEDDSAIQEFPYKEIVGLEDFQEALSANNSALIKFYSPNCPACKMVEKDFRNAAKKHGRTISFLAVDCTSDENKPICNMFAIEAYPTIVSKIITQDVGAISKNALEQKISSIKSVAKLDSSEEPEIATPLRSKSRNKKRSSPE